MLPSSPTRGAKTDRYYGCIPNLGRRQVDGRPRTLLAAAGWAMQRNDEAMYHGLTASLHVSLSGVYLKLPGELARLITAGKLCAV